LAHSEPLREHSPRITDLRLEHCPRHRSIRSIRSQISGQILMSRKGMLSLIVAVHTDPTVASSLPQPGGVQAVERSSHGGDIAGVRHHRAQTSRPWFPSATHGRDKIKLNGGLLTMHGSEWSPTHSTTRRTCWSRR